LMEPGQRQNSRFLTKGFHELLLHFLYDLDDYLVVHSGKAWMRTRADKSAVCTINRHLRFSQQ